MLITGIGLFLSEPTKCYYSVPFWWKMSSLALAMLFTFTVRRKVAMADDRRVRPICRRTLWAVAAWPRRSRSGRLPLGR